MNQMITMMFMTSSQEYAASFLLHDIPNAPTENVITPCKQHYK